EVGDRVDSLLGRDSPVAPDVPRADESSRLRLGGDGREREFATEHTREPAMVQQAPLPVALAPAVVAIAEPLDGNLAALVADRTTDAAGHLEVIREPLRRDLVVGRKWVDQRIEAAALELCAEWPVRDRP